ncbi:MAG: hypothetical protein K8J09_13900 [Planctomycetes bacterium]|nr:hypothetical protein [Planctomycetota bacterium]MCC7399450.1 hypothetical protein [Planctomycetota bacterium]
MCEATALVLGVARYVAALPRAFGDLAPGDVEARHDRLFILRGLDRPLARAGAQHLAVPPVA